VSAYFSHLRSIYLPGRCIYRAYLVTHDSHALLMRKEYRYRQYRHCSPASRLIATSTLASLRLHSLSLDKRKGMVCAMNVNKEPPISASLENAPRREQMRAQVQMPAPIPAACPTPSPCQKYGISRANHTYIWSRCHSRWMHPTLPLLLLLPSVSLSDLAHLPRACWRAHFAVHA
jgi:hypothetical protein